ncbi:MAG TPA: fumarylacetoacetate hydrolase family protein [Acidimicrobiales bacterium]|nr:fumarylacetoacetate hydrolase family protein [Acidimicrobiales bacterium]
MTAPSGPAGAVRLVNLGGRACLDRAGAAVDVAQASSGRWGPDPMQVLAAWDDVVEWARGVDQTGVAFDARDLAPVVPRPAKVFAVALNYRRHAEETGAALPPTPSVFTKFPSCLAGPASDVVLPSSSVDWEVELVVVVGRGGRDIPAERARDHIAGYTIGQDFSEREVQYAGSVPQFSLGKSFDTFGPIGPAIVTLDAFADPDDLELWCEVSGERVQHSRTGDLIFSVPELISYLSGICTLEPGDLVFTGTPSGVGVARSPQRFLRDGDVVVSGIEGIGTMTNRARAGSPRA